METRSSQAVELDTLRKSLAGAEARLQERNKILDSLQHRYESRTTDLHQTRRERDSLTAAKQTLEQRVEKQRDDMTKLKDERTELKDELQKARQTIREGGGTAAEIEAAQAEVRRLSSENASLKRTADYERNQSQYTREQYQNASTAAASTANEVRQLTEDKEALNRKVAGEASRLREINKQNDEARHLSKISELEATLARRDELLRRKDEELREIRKNRPSTRSTSVPRSPKWPTSRPSSPGLGNNNNNGSGLAGRGSALRYSSELR